MTTATKGKVEVYAINLLATISLNFYLIPDWGMSNLTMAGVLLAQLALAILVLRKVRAAKWLFLIFYYLVGFTTISKFLFMGWEWKYFFISGACFFSSIFIQFSPNILDYFNEGLRPDRLNEDSDL